MRVRVRVLAGEAERIRAAAAAEGVEIREWLRLAVEDALGTWQPPDGPPALRMEVELPGDVAERARTLAWQMGIGTLCELTRRAALDRLQRGAVLEALRDSIERRYVDHPTGCGASFGELLCHELHTAGLTFRALAEKWGVSLPVLGELVRDHCARL